VYETGYYRILHDHESDYYREEGFRAGELAYVVAGGAALHALVGDRTFTYEYSDQEHMAGFAASFQYHPDGVAARQQEIVQLMSEVAAADLAQSQVQRQLEHFQPYAAGGALDTGTELIPTGGMADAKRAVAQVRNTIGKTKLELERKTGRLQALLREQTRALDLRAQELKGLLAKAEEAIWSINLYLGKNEDIHVLRTGVAAPAGDHVVLRQQVLYMDEECALVQGGSGIDVRSIEQFDGWLLESDANLERVLPDRKGIVALHIRRHEKQYGDPLTNATHNDANLNWTYFLVRNGENLYRVYVDINVGGQLFPARDEFDGLFDGLVPGSREYMRAVEAANESNRHYLRVVLVLQGLLDRTTIFRPMPLERVNLCDPDHCSEYVRFVYHEPDRILTDGRPTFREWQRTINDRLEVGCRIVGNFGYDLRGSRRDYTESRLYPESACLPGDDELHTIDEREGDRYLFRYVRRQDTVYPRYGRAHPPKTRARCWVEKDDRFFLNFDAATLEELRYYGTQRQSRNEYETMVPVLRTAVARKLEEHVQEAPFRLLLVGQVARHYNLPVAEVQVDELITWWKFKNRTHRALTSDDSKALEMIVAECGVRRRNDATRNRLNHRVVVDAAHAGQQPLLVAHKSGTEYVVYVPENDQHVWVREQEWRLQGDRAELRRERRWRLVDKRHQRWQLVYQHERWAHWVVNPQRSQVLTDDELRTLVEQACERLRPRHPRFLPLAAVHDSFAVELWYSSAGPIIPNLLVSGGRITAPVIRMVRLPWEHKQGNVSLAGHLGDGSQYCVEGWDTDHMGRKRDAVPVRVWPENGAQVDRELRESRLAESTSRELRQRYDDLAGRLEVLDHRAQVNAAYAEFLTEYGDPELWPEHLKSLKLQRPCFRRLREALSWWAERGLDPVGRTVGEAMDAARGWGLTSDDQPGPSPDLVLERPATADDDAAGST